MAHPIMPSKVLYINPALSGVAGGKKPALYDLFGGILKVERIEVQSHISGPCWCVGLYAPHETKTFGNISKWNVAAVCLFGLCLLQA
jgi:hypothetical protein